MTAIYTHLANGIHAMTAPTEAGAGKSEKVRRIGKPGDGEYEYRGVNVWRNFGTPAGYYAAWLARMGGKNVSFCTRREACDAIDARAKATGAQP